MSRALCWLQMGDFERGWAEYEWRLKCEEFSIPAFRQPLWDGSPLDGRPILLYADHGLGDSIQFIRYASMVKARGGRVIVACQQPLARLLATCPGVDQVIAEGSELPDFDVYAPLMSLPRIFGTSTAEHTGRCPVPDRRRRSRSSSGSRELEPRGGFKIGIAWQGNPRYRRDRQRSFRLAQLEPLAACRRRAALQPSEGRWYRADRRARRPFCRVRPGQPVLRLHGYRGRDAKPRPGDYVRFVAGAPRRCARCPDLGRDSRSLADWRWLTDREDSPWYPTMRLFRQKTWGDWDEVFERMARELEV